MLCIHGFLQYHDIMQAQMFISIQALIGKLIIIILIPVVSEQFKLHV